MAWDRVWPTTSAIARPSYNPFLSARTLYVHERVNLDGAADFTSNSFTWLAAAGAALFLARNVALTGDISTITLISRMSLAA